MKLGSVLGSMSPTVAPESWSLTLGVVLLAMTAFTARVDAFGSGVTRHQMLTDASATFEKVTGNGRAANVLRTAFDDRPVHVRRDAQPVQPASVKR